MTTLLQGTPAYEFFSPDISGPNNTQLSSLNRIICNCSSGAKSIGLVLILVPGRSNLEIETGGLLHDILAGEVVLALPQHLLEAFGDAVGKHVAASSWSCCRAASLSRRIECARRMHDWDTVASKAFAAIFRGEVPASGSGFASERQQGLSNAARAKRS
jgi:hypothetical protein